MRIPLLLAALLLTLSASAATTTPPAKKSAKPKPPPNVSFTTTTLSPAAKEAVRCATQEGFPCMNNGLQSFKEGVYPKADCTQFCARFSGPAPMKVALAVSEAQKARAIGASCMAKVCGARKTGPQMDSMMNADMNNLLLNLQKSCKCKK